VGERKKAEFGPPCYYMGLKDDTKDTKSPTILPFSVEKNKPQLSIHIDGADIGFLYMEYYTLVYNRCLDILHNAEGAKDAAHDVFANLQELKSKDKLKIQYPKAYLSETALNMSINLKKKAARRRNSELFDMATGGSLTRNRNMEEQKVWEIGIIESGYEQIEAEIIVKAIIDEQDETLRKIYFYKFHDDMTLEQIGKLVGLRKSAVHKRIKKLEAQVRAQWGGR
jgi:RNA polymerase sigma factor (sigma-70 family)